MKVLKPKEPKVGSLILTAGSGVCLGALLGVSLLLARPVQVVSTPPDEAVLSQPGNYNTYVLPGRVAGSESANLRSGTGRILRRTAGPVSFSEDEINYFFENIEFPEPEVEGEEDAKAQGGAKMGPFVIRIVGDKVYGSYKIVIDPQGTPFELRAVSEISFENTDAGPVLHVSNTRINSLPIPDLGGIFSSMVANKIAETAWPEDLIEMWQNIRKIEVESDKVITEVGLRRA